MCLKIYVILEKVMLFKKDKDKRKNSEKYEALEKIDVESMIENQWREFKNVK